MLGKERQGGTSCIGWRWAIEDWRPAPGQIWCITEIHTFIFRSVTRHSASPALWFIILAAAKHSSFIILPPCKNTFTQTVRTMIHLILYILRHYSQGFQRFSCSAIRPRCVCACVRACLCGPTEGSDGSGFHMLHCVHQHESLHVLNSFFYFMFLCIFNFVHFI